MRKILCICGVLGAIFTVALVSTSHASGAGPVSPEEAQQQFSANPGEPLFL
jgi:hypothetical protein